MIKRKRNIDECIKQVRKKYPTAICVKTNSSEGEHYRIWPTNGFFETRVVAKGKIQEEAWKNAVVALENT